MVRLPIRGTAEDVVMNWSDFYLLAITRASVTRNAV
jgi:hypothetical protein